MTMESLRSGVVNVEPRAIDSDGMSVAGTLETFPYAESSGTVQRCAFDYLVASFKHQ